MTLVRPTSINRKELYADSDYPASVVSPKECLNSQYELRGNEALMCSERDPSTCHRSVVAQAPTVVTDQKPVHLGVGGLRHASAVSRRH